MTTQSAHRVRSNPAIGVPCDETEHRVGARVSAWFRQAYCGLHGHDNLMQFEKNRMYLQCSSCGHQSPGWMLKGAQPKIVFRGDERRHRLSTPHLVSARRIA